MTVDAIVKIHGNDRENLLSMLHDLQARSPDHSLHREAAIE